MKRKTKLKIKNAWEEGWDVIVILSICTFAFTAIFLVYARIFG